MILTKAQKRVRYLKHAINVLLGAESTDKYLTIGLFMYAFDLYQSGKSTIPFIVPGMSSDSYIVDYYRLLELLHLQDYQAYRHLSQKRDWFRYVFVLPNEEHAKQYQRIAIKPLVNNIERNL